MRLRPLARDEVRELDAEAARELSLPTLVLMENAGRGAASWLVALATLAPASTGAESSSDALWSKVPDLSHSVEAPTVAVLCGSGNNGGDGAVVARHLDSWGVPVRVIWFASAKQLRGDAATQWTILEKSGIEQLSLFDVESRANDVDLARLERILVDADWLVDALLGTGLSRPVEDPLRAVIEAMNRTGKPILSLDLPSGLDADTGQPLGVAVCARATVTFVAPKVGFAAPGAGKYTGEIVVVDIGLPRKLLQPFRTSDST
jgi:NAD(P)H-hydrate epimerase